jgi:hypothetical protein
MNVEFFNQDHEKISVRVRAGNTESNFGLVRNDRHAYDSGPNPLRFAWKIGDEQVTNDEFDACATAWTGSSTIVFGNPDGEAGVA